MRAFLLAATLAVISPIAFPAVPDTLGHLLKPPGLDDPPATTLDYCPVVTPVLATRNPREEAALIAHAGYRVPVGMNCTL